MWSGTLWGQKIGAPAARRQPDKERPIICSAFFVWRRGARSEGRISPLVRTVHSQGHSGGLRVATGGNGRSGCAQDLRHIPQRSDPAPRLAQAAEVTEIAMESTGVYWRPV